MTEEYRIKGIELSYHEYRVLDILAPSMRLSEDVAVEHVRQAQILEAANVLRAIREAGIALRPVINGKAEDEKDVTCCKTCSRPARTKYEDEYYCGTCLGVVLAAEDS